MGMDTRLNGAKLVLVLAVLVALLSGGSLRAQEPQPLQAPTRPSATGDLPPGTGFRAPELDLSHLDGQHLPAGAHIMQLPAVWDWRAEGAVTGVRDQGGCGACYAFGALGDIESELLIDDASTYDLSENNAKECNWRELSDYGGGTWGSCSGGNYQMLTTLFATKGTVLEADDPYVDSDVACNSCVPYQQTLLDWRIISGPAIPNTDVLKQYIYDHGPVAVSMYANSEFQAYDGSYTMNYASIGSTNHAVLIVGWSNELPPLPGQSTPAEGWIVKNSWGAGWAAGGYFYMAYGAGDLGRYASFTYDWKTYDPADYVLYYDEDGWSTNWGYGDTTAWGLVRFTPPADTNATRIEFWTNDSPATVDVYLYDTFNGSTLSDLLASRTDQVFAESGYHSVQLAAPVALTAGDDVYVAVYFDNNSYDYPVAADRNGPAVAGRTWISNSGTSWIDMGAGYADEVSIRLRTNHPDGGAYYLRGEQCGWDTTTCPLYDDATHGDGWADDRIHSLSHTVNSPLSSYDGFKFWRADGNKWLPSGSDLTFDSVGACTIYMLAQANPYGITVNDCQSYAYVTCDAATHDFSPVSFLGNEDFGPATEAYVTEGDTVDLRVEVYAAGLTDAGAATAGSAVQVGLETRTWQAASQTWGTWTDYGTPFSFELDEGNNWQYLLPGVSLPQGIHELRAKYTDWTGATGNTGSNTRVLFVSDAANTPHSIQVDAALADWRANESHAGRDGTTNDVTWDDRYVYVAWDGGGSSDKCIVGFDLDLGTANDTVAYGGAAFPATGQPDFVLEYYKGTDATYFFQRSGATWVDVGTSGIAVAEGSSPVACEARIPRTRFGGDLDLDDDLGIVIYQSNSTSSWVFGASPVAGNSSGSATQSLNAQFHWPSTGSDVAPNAPAVGGRSEYAVHAVAGGAAGSYVFGETGATIDFPLADDAPDAGCDIDARVYENHLLPNGSAAVKRHYELQAGGCAGYSADLTLSYADGELNGNTETSLDLYRWTGSAWELHSVSSEDRDTTNNQLAARDVTAFSSWGADDASPTAIDLASFAAQPLAGAVSLKWQTASEVNLIGFHLYRAVAGSPEVRLNADLIPARQPGSPIGASYAWLDDHVAPGVTCNYWLEWLDSLGAPQRYGPVSVVPFTLYHIYLPLVTH